MEKEQARWIYKTMNEIRYFEEKVHKIFSDGQIPGFVHLYVGEEAVATGVMSLLEDDDYITSTHRGHGHAIAKGCDLNGMMAEIMGKRDGLGHGKGGSMHVAEIDKGMLGANGIVSGGFGLAAGAGISIRNQKKNNVAVCFFGDGAANEGNFHEGLNFASILDLPVIFARSTASLAAFLTSSTSIPSTLTPGMLYAFARSAIVSDALAVCAN